MLASAGSDETVRLWDPITETLKTTLPGHTGFNAVVTFRSDGRTLASAGDDQMIQFWDYTTSQHKSAITGHTFPVNEIAFAAQWTNFRECRAMARQFICGIHTQDNSKIHSLDMVDGSFPLHLVQMARHSPVAVGGEIPQFGYGTYTLGNPRSLSKAINMVWSPSCLVSRR